MADGDTLHRFLFEQLAVRGGLARLNSSLEQMVSGHRYPLPIRRRVGEAMAGAALLGASIKGYEQLSLQLQGEGPLRLLLTQCSRDRNLRALARWRGEVAEGPLAEQSGGGLLAITIDPGAGKVRYQGLVALHADSLAQTLEDYFRQSEQLATCLRLASDGRRAAGFMLQAMPEAEPDGDTWNRLSLVAATLTDEELLDLSARETLHRLFHEDDVRLFEGERLTARCTCSRDSVRSLLRNLGRQEVEATLAEQGHVEVRCEFCGKAYRFDAVDAGELFTPVPGPAGPGTPQ